MSCTTPTSDLSTVELDDSIEDDNFSIENESWENNDTDTIEIVKSTKEPLKSRQINTQKRQADHEYSLIKNLSDSISQRNKKPKPDETSKKQYDAFGKYVSQALSDLDSATRHLAQHQINNIIFQAQTGMLTQDSQQAVVVQPQYNQFRPIQSYHIPSTNNYPTSPFN